MRQRVEEAGKVGPEAKGSCPAGAAARVVRAAMALPVGMAVTVGMHAAHLLLRRRRRRHSKSKMAVCSLVRGCRRNLVL